MADPAPIGGNAGTLANAPPDDAALNASLSDLDTQGAAAVAPYRAQEQVAQEKSSASEEQAVGEAEKAAGELSAEDAEMQHWIDHTPTRQAAYATAMHTAPIMAILTALGGKLTKLNGMQMLAATNGIVSGLNESSEKKYTDSMNAWNAAYQQMRDHQQRLMDTHKIMMEAYRGRADAYQKAVEAARRMTGDILDDTQRKKQATIDAYKAQAAAWEKTQRLKYSWANQHEKILEHIDLQNHRKAIEAAAAKMSPENKAKIAAAQRRELSAEKQDEMLLKERGQTVGNLSMPEDLKTQRLADIDRARNELVAQMRSAQDEQDAVVASMSATPGAPAAALTPGTTTPAPNTERSGQPASGGDQPPPEAIEKLKASIGKPVKFTNGQTWIMSQDGTVSRVQ